MSSRRASEPVSAESIRIRGTVQGVGFRPSVWRYAREFELCGFVWNDTEGVVIQVWGSSTQINGFVERLSSDPPPLAKIDRIERAPLEGGEIPSGFSISESRLGEARTDISPDAATCGACAGEVIDRGNRRFRYPFTNCTHCGPRLSIIRGIPYDRANTSMSVFPMCEACRREYEDPANRRFHAQPNACRECGPRVWLENVEGVRIPAEGAVDEIAAARRLIAEGRILAIKGIGGIHLACDARNEAAVDRLRSRKRRYQKAFALMAGDIATIRRYARVDAAEQTMLESPEAPIVILDAEGESLPSGIAPGQKTLGFMLPYTPLHQLLMQGDKRPIILTSGNRSDEPQTIRNDDGRRRLGEIADFFLLHDREIVNRLDDSVCRIMDHQPRLLRRARGYAPTPLPMPAGFEGAADILAMGGELKNTFCLLKDGKAILSQHMGDLEDAATFADYRCNLELYRRLFDLAPRRIAVDMHPEYLSTKHGGALAEVNGLPLVGVQHHHAHIAACMVEGGLELGCPDVLGIALDGLGFGADGEIWGGEFLKCGYAEFERLARFRPVAMLGGTMAVREPWRNTFAHLESAMGWERLVDEYGDLELVRFLREKPADTLRAMIVRGLNSPPASSAGRLFDAVAAAIGLSRDGVFHEGQAAIELETLAVDAMEDPAVGAYVIERSVRGDLNELGWEWLWLGLLDDLRQGLDHTYISAKFHRGLANAVADLAVELCSDEGLGRVVLSGGVFQNRLLLEGVSARLRERGLSVLSPAMTPANDGGISLGQAAVAAARSLGEVH